MAGLPRAAFTARLLAIPRQNVPLCRRIHSSPLRAAVAHPITAHGPPPKAPAPAPGFTETAETQKAAESTAEGRDLSQFKKPTVLKKRFWKDVHVHGKPGML
jgi:ATP synthase F1 complex assembly factor 2